MNSFRTGLMAFTAITAAFSAHGAWAQEAETLEEVTVVATRRSSAAQTTPIAISALSGELISKRLNDTLFDAAPQLPGLTLNGTAGYGNFPLGIRGIASSTSLIGSDDPVAVYLDGVYLGKPSAAMADLNDVGQIEVVRGPQGSLYGRNATAGAVLIGRREPGVTPELSGSLSYGSFGRWRVSGRAAGPISGEALRGGLSITTTDAEGWGTNTFNGSKVVSRRATSALGTLVYEGEALKAVLRVDYLDETVHDGYKKLNAVAYVAATPQIADAALRGDESTFAMNFPTGLDHKAGGATLTLSKDIGELKLQSVTSWRFDDLKGSIDTDGTAANVNTNTTDENHKQFTQSLTLSGETDVSSWVIGLDAYRGDTEIRQVVGLVPAASSLTISAKAEVSAVGLFGEYTRKFGDALAITGGLRANYDKKDFDNGSVGLGVFPSTARFTLEGSWSSLTPALRVAYTPTRDLLVYGSITKGFKSGGMSALQATPFAPETVWSYEVGAKWTSPDQRLRINGDVFYADYKNLQVRVSRGLGLIQTLNAGQATIKGAELESHWIFAEGWRLSGFANYVDAQYESYIGPGPNDNAGEALNRAPKWQTGATLGWEHGFTGFGVVSAEAVYSYRSRIFFSAPNVKALSSEAYSQIDARVGWEREDGRWNVSLVGKNLTEDRHINNVIIFGGNLVASFNEPRSVQVQLGFKY